MLLDVLTIPHRNRSNSVSQGHRTLERNGKTTRLRYACSSLFPCPPTLPELLLPSSPPFHACMHALVWACVVHKRMRANHMHAPARQCCAGQRSECLCVLVCVSVKRSCHIRRKQQSTACIRQRTRQCRHTDACGCVCVCVCVCVV